MSLQTLTNEFAKMIMLESEIPTTFHSKTKVTQLATALNNIYSRYQNEEYYKNLVDTFITRFLSNLGNRKTRTIQKTYNELVESLQEVKLSLNNYREDIVHKKVISYIHMRNIEFFDVSGGSIRGFDILTDKKYRIQEDDEFYTYNNCTILYYTYSVEDMIDYALADDNVLIEIYDKLSVTLVSSLTPEQKQHISDLVDKQKQQNVLLFQTPRNDGLPCITKDIVNMINEMAYAEYDIQKQLDNNIKELDLLYQEAKNTYIDCMSEKEILDLTLKSTMIMYNVFKYLFNKIQTHKEKSYMYKLSYKVFDSYIEKIINIFYLYLNTEVGRINLNTHVTLKNTLEDRRLYFLVHFPTLDILRQPL